jgi:hypothetical protein
LSVNGTDRLVPTASNASMMSRAESRCLISWSSASRDFHESSIVTRDVTIRTRSFILDTAERLGPGEPCEQRVLPSRSSRSILIARRFLGAFPGESPDSTGSSPHLSANASCRLQKRELGDTASVPHALPPRRGAGHRKTVIAPKYRARVRARRSLMRLGAAPRNPGPARSSRLTGEAAARALVSRARARVPAGSASLRLSRKHSVSDLWVPETRIAGSALWRSESRCLSG